MNRNLIRSQSGAIFANLALGTAALGGAAAVTVDWTAQQSALALQKQQGYIFSRLNDAVGNYMTLLFPQLTEQTAGGIDVIPAECANVPYRYGKSASTDPVILAGKCQLSLPLAGGGSYVLKNALQPTVADLKALNLLDLGISDKPVLVTEAVIAGPESTGAASTSMASNGYVIIIQPKCVGKGSGSGSGAGASTCSNVNKVLSSSVLNIQPFKSSTYVQNFQPLLWATGPDAAMSGPPDASNIQVQTDRTNPTGEFRSSQAGWTRENPITREWSYSTASTSVQYLRGVDNLVLVRNGYDSAYWQMIRRDGSSPPTSTWDFNGQDLKKVGLLTAASAEISGDLTVGGNQAVKGNQTITGNQAVTGNVKVDGTATIKGVLTGMADLFVEGATSLKGKLTVAGKALFKDDVTLQKNLEVRGSATIDGDLSAGSATFNGALLANSLMIGGTQITPDGTLLGAAAGWGVTVGASCGVDLALAQSTDGKVQICRNAAWTPLITNENIVKPAPAPDQACSPEGSPGRLPDGTLVICTNGKWESIAQGDAAEGSTCMVEGALATTAVASASARILMACQAGKWTTSVFAKPKLSYATQGYSCQINDELALDGRGYPSLLICKSGTWQPPGTQLLSNMELGAACSLDGVLAGDVNRTGLLFCNGGVWSKIIESISLGGSCSPEGKKVTSPSGAELYCMNSILSVAPKAGDRCTSVGKVFQLSANPRKVLYCNLFHEGDFWSLTPGSVDLYRYDGAKVTMSRLVQYNGDDYYIYSERGDAASTHQVMHGISWWLIQQSDPVYVYSGLRTSGVNFSAKHGWTLARAGQSHGEAVNDKCNYYEIKLPTVGELQGLASAFGGLPRQWRFDGTDTEFWTSDRCDEVNCNGGNWWDHVTVDWGGRVRHRWNTDYWGVALKIRRPLAGDSCDSP